MAIPIRPADLPAVPGGTVDPASALIIDDGAGVWKATPAEIIEPVLGADGGAALIGTASGGTVQAFINAPVVTGDNANIFQIRFTGATNALNVNTATPFVSVNGTRTSNAPRITGGTGTDAGFDSFITSNCVAVSSGALFRDEFQDWSTLTSPGGAHASFDAANELLGANDMNHQRDIQCRGKVSLTGGPGTLLSEKTGLYVQPVFNGDFQIDQLAPVWIRDAIVSSGSPSVVHAYGMLVDELTQGSGTIYAAYVTNNDVFLGKNLQMRNTVVGQGDIFNVRQFRGLSAEMTGSLVAFDAGGGMVLAGKAGGGDYATIFCHADGGGVTPRGLSVRTNNMVVGSDLPTTGAQLESVGAITAATYVKSGVYTVATLPSAATAGSGSRAWVTDANATTFLSIVASGGANKVPVSSDGTNWLIG